MAAAAPPGPQSLEDLLRSIDRNDPATQYEKNVFKLDIGEFYLATFQQYCQVERRLANTGVDEVEIEHFQEKCRSRSTTVFIKTIVGLLDIISTFSQEQRYKPDDSVEEWSWRRLVCFINRTENEDHYRERLLGIAEDSYAHLTQDLVHKAAVEGRERERSRSALKIMMRRLLAGQRVIPVAPRLYPTYIEVPDAPQPNGVDVQPIRIALLRYTAPANQNVPGAVQGGLDVVNIVAAVGINNDDDETTINCLVEIDMLEVRQLLMPEVQGDGGGPIRRQVVPAQRHQPHGQLHRGNVNVVAGQGADPNIAPFQNPMIVDDLQGVRQNRFGLVPLPQNPIVPLPANQAPINAIQQNLGGNQQVIAAPNGIQNGNEFADPAGAHFANNQWQRNAIRQNPVVQAQNVAELNQWVQGGIDAPPNHLGPAPPAAYEPRIVLGRIRGTHFHGAVVQLAYFDPDVQPAEIADEVNYEIGEQAVYEWNTLSALPNDFHPDRPFFYLNFQRDLIVQFHDFMQRLNDVVLYRWRFAEGTVLDYLLEALLLRRIDTLTFFFNILFDHPNYFIELENKIIPYGYSIRRNRPPELHDIQRGIVRVLDPE